MTIREFYEARAAERFVAVQTQIHAMATRMQAAVEAGEAADEAFVAAQSRHDEARQKFELLKSAHEDQWGAAKTSFETAWERLDRALAPVATLPGN